MSQRQQSLPRFRRVQPSDLPAFRYQSERDSRIEALIADYSIIRSDHLKHLAPGSPQQNLRRFQKLFHHQHINRLERHRLPFNYPMVYTHKDPKLISDLYLKHTLAISHFRFALEMAIAATPGATITEWWPEGTVQESVSYQAGDRQFTKTIKPDAVFKIAYQGATIGGFVEVDRSTIAGTTRLSGRLFRRYEAYWHYWRQKLWREQFGFSSMRVFTVTISEARKENFRGMVKCVGEQKQGSNLFWFAPMQAYEASPTAFLNPLWQTPRDDAYRALLPP
jgi:hypothetical protein